MIISPHEQRSPEWINERLGLPTSSRFKEIITSTGKPTKKERRQKYLYELAGEIQTGRPADRFVTYKMKEAAEREEYSLLHYELTHYEECRRVGLCYKDEHKMFGASPDLLIEPDGGLETKDAEPHVQIERFLNGWNGKAEHYHQVQGCMFVCGRKWWILRSYCERMEPIDILYKRDEDFIEALEKELNKFCLDIAMLIKKLKGG